MKKTLSLMAIASASMFVMNSCSQDDMLVDTPAALADNDIITFKANVGRNSRGNETTYANLGENGDRIYLSAFYRDRGYDPATPNSSPDNDLWFNVYDEEHEWFSHSEKGFSNQKMEETYSDKIMFWNRAYKRSGDQLVLDEDNQNPFHWPGSGQFLTFVGYYPSLDYFSEDILSKYSGGFNNYSYFKSVFANYYYTNKNEEYTSSLCLKWVAINPDISKQRDLVVAKPVTDNRETPTPSEANGIKPKTTTLNFEHVLSQVEIRAKLPEDSEVGKTYEVKVAGIKISNPRNFATYDIISGEWVDAQLETPNEYDNISVRDNKDYTRGANTYRFAETEDAVFLKSFPQSLMGMGGSIFTIPTERERSTLKPQNDQHGMYIGVLLRVTRKDNGKVVFPYDDKYTFRYEDLDKIEDSQEFLSALKHYLIYRGPDGEYYQWAAIPVEVKWEKGKHYIYTLDFSNGVGYNDPADGLTEDGGIPILNGKVNVKCTVTEWVPEDKGTVTQDTFRAKRK